MATLTIGFTGGLTLTRRTSSEAVEGLRSALDADDRPWHELPTEQGTVVISLPRLAYFELADGDRRVGFD